MSKVRSELKTLALEAVTVTELPVSVEYVARKLGIGWGTARAFLLELALEGKISARKTMKSWIFSTSNPRRVRDEGSERI